MKGNNKNSKTHGVDEEKKSIKPNLTGKHEILDDEIKPLTFLNKAVNELNGLRGVYLEEGYELKNMFSWNTTHVFRIFEADALGVKLNENSTPFLFGIGQHQPCCQCQRAFGGCCCKSCSAEFDMIVTKDSESEPDTQAPETIFYVEKRNECESLGLYSTLYVNDKGRSTEVGVLQSMPLGYLFTSNKYVNNLSITFNICQASVYCGSFCCCKSCQETEYRVKDSDGNEGVLVMENHTCGWGFCNFRLGFPPKYNSDQSSVLLACTIYLAFERSKKSNKSTTTTTSIRY